MHPSFSGLLVTCQELVAFRSESRKSAYLGIASPNDLASSRSQTQLAHVDLDNSTLGQNTELCVQGVLRVLLDADDLLEGQHK